jgi:phage shock protein A
MTTTKIKSAAKNVGNGVLAFGAACHNASVQNQINEIDEQADALRAQLTRLEENRSELVDRKI